MKQHPEIKCLRIKSFKRLSRTTTALLISCLFFSPLCPSVTHFVHKGGGQEVTINLLSSNKLFHKWGAWPSNEGMQSLSIRLYGTFLRQLTLNSFWELLVGMKAIFYGFDCLNK